VVHGATRERLRDAAEAFSNNWGNPNLRRAQLSFFAAWAAECAFSVALTVVAYAAGGALAVGFVGLIVVLPSAVLTPVLAPLADRGRRERVLSAVATVRATAMALAAISVALAAPVGFVYAAAAASSVAATLFRPAHSALLPTLCRTGRELASANVVRGMLDSIASLIGPLAAAALLAFADASLTIGVAAASALGAALLVLHLRYEGPPAEDRRRPALAAEAADGIRTVLRTPGLALILALVAAQTFTRGALTVFSVVVAVELLGMGGSGAGTLMAAFGVGAICGSLAASVLAGMWRLGAWFSIGVALWGLPIALIGVFPEQAAALALLAVVGVANALIDVAGFTLIGRLAPDAVLARVFGVLETLVALSIGAGSILASTLIEAFGVEPALLVIGLVCPTLGIAAWWRLHRIDRSVDALDHEIGLLRRVPVFTPLPLPAIERLARGLEPIEVAAGDTVFQQGDVGDRYYLIESGAAEVIGEDGTVVATMTTGEGFGEIALLRRSRRTATIRARTALRLRAITAPLFTGAVLGFSLSASAAAASATDRLQRYAPTRPDDPPGESRSAANLDT